MPLINLVKSFSLPMIDLRNNKQNVSTELVCNAKTLQASHTATEIITDLIGLYQINSFRFSH